MTAGNGYIPTSSLREILRELDEQLTEEELDGLIQEIDTDGSGTVDFDGKYGNLHHLFKSLFHPSGLNWRVLQLTFEFVTAVYIIPSHIM